MKISINEHNQIRLSEVFEPIEIVSTEGQSIFIHLRDGGFEIGIENIGTKSPDNCKYFSWHRIKDNYIEPLAMENNNE